MTTVDFVETPVETPRIAQAMVQVADKTKLSTNLQIDWKLQYLRIHSTGSIQAGEFVEYQARRFKVISDSDWLSYGYAEVIAEEVK